MLVTLFGIVIEARLLHPENARLPRVLSSQFGENATTAKFETAAGNVKLYDTAFAGDATISVTSGNINFDKFDAQNINATTVAGNIQGTLLTAKKFDAVATIGSVNVPETTTGGNCVLRVTTGNINISLVS